MSVRFIPNRVTVDFEELKGSPEERSTSEWGGDSATRSLQCDSGIRLALERELLGFTEVRGSNADVFLPAPFGPDRPGLVATSVITKPLGQTGGVEADFRWANHPYATLIVTYEVADRITSNRYGFVTLTEELRDTSEFLTLPIKELYWGTGGSAELIDTYDAPGKINYGIEWTYTISGAYRVPPQIFDYVGMVNSVAITKSDIGRTFMPYTLLYAAPIVAKELTFRGTIYRITLRFLHKDNGTPADPKGWNWFPRSSKAGAEITFERITDGIDGKIFYPNIDFRDVFA